MRSTPSLCWCLTICGEAKSILPPLLTIRWKVSIRVKQRLLYSGSIVAEQIAERDVQRRRDSLEVPKRNAIVAFFGTRYGCLRQPSQVRQVVLGQAVGLA